MGWVVRGKGRRCGLGSEGKGRRCGLGSEGKG